MGDAFRHSWERISTESLEYKAMARTLSMSDYDYHQQIGRHYPKPRYEAPIFTHSFQPIGTIPTQPTSTSSKGNITISASQSRSTYTGPTYF
ncbi:MAG: hypothetical protein Gaeavirus21_6 [Gaeavirus sp.]|uniref:Uncharacterized protein n=1 Tax=Gaeavirus sp. TaxID=2487767 RepID=A0A3G5A228_9VIRU|nr:MAG: hypothetical protein Gaeavirus21_6 [Gaeavirus sp.]